MALPPDPKTAQPEHIALWLPSALPPAWLQGGLAQGLGAKEIRLRIAQADDSLEDICRLRRVLTGIAEFKRLNVSGSGQKANTRIRTLYDKFQLKINCAAERYRAARLALESLDPNSEWTTRLKVLNAADIRGPGREDQEGSEGRYELSWIWLVPRPSFESSTPAASSGSSSTPSSTSNPAEFVDSMHTEWARSRARAARWGEEVELLGEEMRRVIEYFEWKAKW